MAYRAGVFVAIVLGLGVASPVGLWPDHVALAPACADGAQAATPAAGARIATVTIRVVGMSFFGIKYSKTFQITADKSSYRFTCSGRGCACPRDPQTRRHLDDR